jgi:hypothetical protein
VTLIDLGAFRRNEMIQRLSAFQRTIRSSDQSSKGLPSFLAFGFGPGFFRVKSR